MADDAARPLHIVHTEASCGWGASGASRTQVLGQCDLATVEAL